MHVLSPLVQEAPAALGTLAVTSAGAAHWGNEAPVRTTGSTSRPAGVVGSTVGVDAWAGAKALAPMATAAAVTTKIRRRM